MLLDVLQSTSLLYNGTLTAVEVATGDFLVHEFGAGLISTWTPVLVYERSSCRIFALKCRSCPSCEKMSFCAIPRLLVRVVASFLHVVEDTPSLILAVITASFNQEFKQQGF